jgi:Fur family zinc uptake transcriptional regulator
MSPHTGPHDHQRCIHDALALADRLCEERGVRFTPQRRRVLELIWSNHESAKAYDLLEALKASDPSAKPATIYRALDFLLEQGFIHRVESLNAYIGCPAPENRHERLLLICERCHTVEERPAPAVMQSVAGEIEAAGFTPRRQSIEVHGLCADCAKDLNAPADK